ncbi:putative ethanolamine kinase [Diplonema papillatum]|nr:putative ethanolamine kinase [Diplonema papillatum]
MVVYRNNDDAVCDIEIPESEAAEHAGKAVAAVVPGWKGEDVSVSPVGGGITNLLFKVTSKGEPSYLVRLYGTNTEVVIDREEDNRLFAKLSELGFAPTFHGRFKNGRVEAFLSCRALEPAEMCSADFFPRIARKLRQMHDTQLPPAKPPLLLSRIENFLAMAGNVQFPEKPRAALLDALDIPKIASEFAWFRREMEGRVHPFFLDNVLSHQDLLSGNVLVDPVDPKSGELHFIDFEYGGYNYRGYDFGNHFCEYAGFECDYSRYPGKEQKKAFIKAYLRDGDRKADETEDSFLNRLADSADVFACASDLLWGVWSVLQAKHSPIDFDFLDYARLRLGAYYYHKALFLEPRSGPFSYEDALRLVTPASS